MYIYICIYIYVYVYIYMCICIYVSVFLEPTFFFHINAFRAEVNRLAPSFPKQGKKENTVCSSINCPCNLVNNAFANVHYFMTQRETYF